METVKISPKYQVVIPRRIRESLQLRPGQRLQIMDIGNRIELIPERDIKDMEGFLAGIDTNVPQEDDRL